MKDNQRVVKFIFIILLLILSFVFYILGDYREAIFYTVMLLMFVLVSILLDLSSLLRISHLYIDYKFHKEIERIKAETLDLEKECEKVAIEIEKAKKSLDDSKAKCQEIFEEEAPKKKRGRPRKEV